MKAYSNLELARLAADVAAAHRQLVDHIHGGVLQRMAEASPGPAAGRMDRSTGGGGIVSDPTASAALRGTRDLAGAHRDELVRTLARARTLVERAQLLIDLYPAPRTADAGDRAALDRINGTSAPGCDSCARTAGPADVPRWEPIYVNLTEQTTVNGVLADPMWLCRWCYDTTAAWGRLPRPDEVERHHTVGRVPWPDDVQRPS